MLNGNLRFSFITGKCGVDKGVFQLWSDKADYGYEDKPGNHGKSACINRGLKQNREVAAEKHIAYHKSGTENKADPCRGSSRFFPVQPVQERRQKRACQRTPGYAHKLCDKSNVSLVLYNGNYHGNADKDYD